MPFILRLLERYSESLLGKLWSKSITSLLLLPPSSIASISTPHWLLVLVGSAVAIIQQPLLSRVSNQRIFLDFWSPAFHTSPPTQPLSLTRDIHPFNLYTRSSLYCCVLWINGWFPPYNHLYSSTSSEDTSGGRLSPDSTQHAPLCQPPRHSSPIVVASIHKTPVVHVIAPDEFLITPYIIKGLLHPSTISVFSTVDFKSIQERKENVFPSFTTLHVIHKNSAQLLLFSPHVVCVCLPCHLACRLNKTKKDFFV